MSSAAVKLSTRSDWLARKSARSVAAMPANWGIGIDSSLGSQFLAKLIQKFAAQYPTVRMSFVDGDQAAHATAIRQSKLDVAFVTGTSSWPDCTTKQLWSERLFVALPESHRLNNEGAITWKDLADERFIITDVPPGLEMHDYLIQRLASAGHHPEIEHHAVGHLNLLALVALGRGATLACEGLAKADFPGVVFLPVEDDHLLFSAIWSPENDNPAFRRFLELGCAMASATVEFQFSYVPPDDVLRDVPVRTPDPML